MVEQPILKAILEDKEWDDVDEFGNQKLWVPSRLPAHIQLRIQQMTGSGSKRISKLVDELLDLLESKVYKAKGYTDRKYIHLKIERVFEMLVTGTTLPDMTEEDYHGLRNPKGQVVGKELELLDKKTSKVES